MKNKTLLLGSLLGIIIIGFLGFNQYQIQEENRMLRASLMQQSSSRGNKGKHADPYVAGPVKNRILKGGTDLKTCYKSYLKKEPDVREGNIKIDWQINTDGRAIKPGIVFSRFSDRSLGECITQKISRWVFPEPLLKTYVSHLFRFNDVKGKTSK